MTNVEICDNHLFSKVGQRSRSNILVYLKRSSHKLYTVMLNFKSPKMNYFD